MTVQEKSKGRGSRVVGRGYQQLPAWQNAPALALRLFHSTESLGSRHRWFANQFVRSAVPVAANIAQGYNRGSIREYAHFLNIARGSLAETEYYLLFAQDAGLFTPDKLDELYVVADDAGNLLLGLIRSLQAKDGRRARMVREGSPPYRADDAMDAFPATRDPRPATLPEEP